MSGHTLFDEVAAPASYPSAPGYKAAGTSKDAAEAIAPRAVKLRDLVLAEIRRKPSTPDEVAKRLGQTVLAVRPRFTELSQFRQIEKTGERRENASGQKANVYRAVAP